MAAADRIQIRTGTTADATTADDTLLIDPDGAEFGITDDRSAGVGDVRGWFADPDSMSWTAQAAAEPRGVWATPGDLDALAGSFGDVHGPSSSVDSEVALFSGTTGKTIKRATGTGIPLLTSGVQSIATPGGDYYAPGGADVAVADGGTGASTLASGGILKGHGMSAVTADGKITDLATQTADYSANGNKFTNLADPTGAQDAATKAYVDATAAGLDLRSACRAATTGAETFTVSSGNVTQVTGLIVDGVTLAVNDRILIKNAPASTGTGVPNSAGAGSLEPGNGIYQVTSTVGGNLAVTRASDQSGTHKPDGDFTFIEAGSTNVASGHAVNVPSTSGAFTYGTNNMQWTQFSGAGEINAGTGIVKSGNTLSADFGSASGKVTEGNDSRLSDARTPTAHAASHASGGGDPVTIAESQVTGLVADLAVLAPLASPTFTGTVTLPTGLTGLAKVASGVVSAVAAPTGTVVGTSDSQALTNKDLTGAGNTFPTFYTPGGTDVAVVDGGTGSSTASAARTALGLAIGTDVLAPNGSAAALTSFPTLNQNTSGTAANLSGTPALPNGTTATTQSTADNSTKLATTAYTDAGLALKAPLASPAFTGTVTLPTGLTGTLKAASGVVSADIVYTLATLQTLTNSNTETTLLTATNIAAAALAAGTAVEFRVGGQLDNISTSGLLTLRVKVNATTVATIGLIGTSQTGSGSATPWSAAGTVIVNTTGSGGAVYTIGDAVCLTTAGGGQNPRPYGGITNINLTGGLQITVTGQWATGNSGNTLRMYGGTVNQIA